MNWIRNHWKEELQVACAVLVSFGIIMETIYMADIWYLFITGGSLAFAISTKINRRKHKED